MAGTLDSSGTQLAGTLSLTMQGASAPTDFPVAGKLRSKRFLLSGTSADGARLRWQGTQRPTGFGGKLRVRGPVKLRGTLVLAARAPRSTACDDVFRSDVMGQVLVPICATCHRAGGAAAGTRLQVVATDLAATETTVAAVIDASNPSASLLLQKPVGDLGHGGGAQIARGGAELAILQNWVDLVSQSRCGESDDPPPDPNDPGAVLYADKCASCHGTQARGVTGPAIRCNRDVSGAVKQGREGPTPATTMRPFPLLTDADIALIQGFLDGLCPAASATGAALFAGNCASCHGADAGGDTGPAIRCSRNAAFAVTNGVIGAFPSYMPELLALSDPEIQKIQDHLLGLCPADSASGTDLFAANCAACHGLSGAGDSGRPDVRCTVPSRLHHALYYGRGFPFIRMPSFTPVLTDTEEARIAGFLTPQCSNTGSGLFASNCASCHGANGQGGRNANGIAGPGIRGASSSDVFDAVVDGYGGMPAIPDLTTGQINAIVSFLH